VVPQEHFYDLLEYSLDSDKRFPYSIMFYRSLDINLLLTCLRNLKTPHRQRKEQSSKEQGDWGNPMRGK
jgi:hypothetical protein